MNLSKFSDYSFRALIILASYPDQRWTIEKLSQELHTSIHHMKKVIYLLSKESYIHASKGRNGQLELVSKPENINLGKLLRLTEKHFHIYECFDKESLCPFAQYECRLKQIASKATQEFINIYDQYTLLDLLKSPHL